MGDHRVGIMILEKAREAKELHKGMEAIDVSSVVVDNGRMK